MNRPRIALFINTPLRDVPGIVLTAYELCQQGAVCYLVPQTGGYGDIWALAPDFVLLPYFRPYFAPRVKKYIEAGIQFGLLDTEGAIWSSMEEYAGTLWEDRSLTKEANLICMWGPALAKYAIDKDLFEANQVTITGCPRFDFYSEPYSAIYEKKTSNGDASESKSILINTNFTSGNYADLPQDEFVENFSKNFGFAKSEVRRWCSIDVEAVAETVRMAGRLARDFPDSDVIIRPHPQEKVEPYEEQAQKLSNLRVTRSGAVSPWILRASAVIQRGCTTAVEANLAGIPAISPQWITVAHDYPIPESISLQCSDYAYLKTTLQSIFSGGFQLPAEIKTAAKSLTDEWFYKIDGLSHKRVADAILSSLSQSQNVHTDRKKCRKFLFGLHNLFPLRTGSIASLLRYGLGLSPNWSFRNRRRGEKVEMEESLQLESIRDLVDSIAAVKSAENVKRVKVSSAQDADDYITKSYVGRTIVMECA